MAPEEQDFMHVMLSFIDNEEFSGYDADTVIKSTCLVCKKSINLQSKFNFEPQ